MNRCQWTDGGRMPAPCDSTDGVRVDPESGPLNAKLCRKHYAEIMRRRDENEASWNRIFRP